MCDLLRATKCAHAFLPEIHPRTTAGMFQDLARFSGPEAVNVQHDYFADFQRLVDHKFRSQRWLLEAVAHPSLSIDLSTMSYQRLEFLGDAVIDMLVVQKLSKHIPRLSHVHMHLIKAVLVNANFLAFLCIEFYVDRESADIQQAMESADLVMTVSGQRLRLCDFMRYQHTEVTRVRQTCVQRYQQVRDSITSAITCGTRHPWCMLAQLEAPKFFSDLVERLIDAIFVDSQGDLSLCEKLAERIGLMPYLMQILHESVAVLHPKNRLSELASGKVRYILTKEEAPKRGLRCSLSIRDVQVAEAREGTSREAVTTRAAEVAALIIGNCVRSFDA